MKPSLRIDLHLLSQIIKSSAFIGTLVTLVFLAISQNYYARLQENNFERQKNNVVLINAFEIVEFIDLKLADLKFKLRGPREVPSNIVLVSVDDRSVEEIGRWPWSRETISKIIEQANEHKAKSPGFDIIFSEQQTTPATAVLKILEPFDSQLPLVLAQQLALIKTKSEPDQILASSIEKNAEMISLGTFADSEGLANSPPYQDYCRNEALLKSQSENFLKLNLSFIVDDTSDPFVDLDFGKVFDSIFAGISIDIDKQVNPTNAPLTDSQIIKARRLKSAEYFKYCNVWLTEDDGLSTQFLESYKTIFSKSDSLKDLEIKAAIEKFKNSVLPIPVEQVEMWTPNSELIQSAANFTASFNAEQDSDGSIRRKSLFFRTGNRIGMSFFPTIALQTYLLSTGYRAKVEIGVDPVNPRQKKITKFEIVNPDKDPEELISRIPVDAQGQLRINYYGPAQMFPYVPAKDLLTDSDTLTYQQMKLDPVSNSYRLESLSAKKSEFLKGKTLLMGATAVGIYDLRVTPFAPNYPGPEIHLSFLGNLFENSFLRSFEIEKSAMFWGLVVFGILLSFILTWSGAVTSFGVTAGALGLILLLDRSLFVKGITWTAAIPLSFIIVLYAVIFFYKYLTEEQQKKLLKATFSKYVSPQVVDEILSHPDNIQLGGRKERMSVFFSDVRGFTTFAERLDPQALSDVLNRYLTPMTQIVFNNKGTLDKYMGDALMAFFGAPIPFKDHAICACRTALQSLEKLKEIQATFKKEGLPEIDIGIGINTSEMSVGNMGSEIIRNYTVMGDAVNLGSRLEGINKEYGTRIIISEFTFEDVKSVFVCREVDLVKVKGKNKPVRIYELLSEDKTDQNLSEWIEVYSNGLRLFREKNFSQAQELFTKVAKELRPDDALSQLYIERCEDFLAIPPPADWDGIVTMKTK